MGILDFFRWNKKTKTETVIREKPSPEQTLFTNTVLEIISPTVEKFGFKRHSVEIKKYSSKVVWRKENLYINVQSTNYPTDYPFFYNVVLGEGNSDNFFEYEWNSIALWRLKNKINPKLKPKEYSFPIEDKVKGSISNTNKEIIKYAESFLSGDLTLFFETRAEQNKDREPYKIYSPNNDGSYTVSYEAKSLRQKEKYS